MTTKPQRISGTRKTAPSEYFENECLLYGYYPEDVRFAFLAALRAFADAQGKSNQPWLLEAVIRKSHGVSTDTSVMPFTDRQRLRDLIERYRVFANGRPLAPVVTFADAHATLRRLFF